MRVIARDVKWSECPAGIAPYTKESQTFLTVGREYRVHGLAIFGGCPAMLVVNDSRSPSWEASWLFDVVDPSIPGDWICNAFHAEPSMVLGPAFFARNLASYEAMVELEAEQVDRFWKHAESLENE
ncbi:MAG: hypothetical protein JW940_12990 [Polyangiaceae bacterium]|nr:hypothetical protein [Polyangiaceae bacterium]